MKDFERFLNDLPKPDVDVPLFGRRLRRELVALEHRGSARRARRVAWLNAAAAFLCGALVLLFVAQPALPAALHARLSGAPADAADPAIERLLRQAAAPVEADEAFVAEWSARQDRPVGVRTMESERIFSVRQFELTDGKRMLVFSEIDDDDPPSRVTRATETARIF